MASADCSEDAPCRENVRIMHSGADGSERSEDVCACSLLDANLASSYRFNGFSTVRESQWVSSVPVFVSFATLCQKDTQRPTVSKALRNPTTTRWVSFATLYSHTAMQS